MTKAREFLDTIEALNLETEAKRNIERIKKALKAGKIDPDTAKETIAYWKEEIERFKKFDKELVGHRVSRPDQAVIRRHKK